MRKSMLVAALAATLGVQAATACGLDGLIDNPFKASYPGSLFVALSTQRAVVNQELVALPKLDGEAAHRRIEERLDQLRGRLEKIQFSGSFALLVVESGHWARFTGNGRTVQVATQGAPPEDGRALLASEAALAALLNGQLAAGAAMQTGLVRWSGEMPPDFAQDLQSALSAGS
jgi:hypothetical protein